MFNIFRSNNTAKDIIDYMPKFAWKFGPSFYIDEKEYTIGELVDYVKNLIKENQELKDQLKSIEEDGTEEHNAAVDLRQENVHLRIMVDTWKELNDQKAITIDELKKENVNLLDNGGLKYMEAKLQIVQNDYKKCAEERDEFKHQLDATNREIGVLKKEKKESFEILKKAIEDESARFHELVAKHTDKSIKLETANKEIEKLKSKVRDWEDKYAKSFSYRDMDKLQKTIDEQKKEIQKLKGDIVDYVIEKDDKLEEAKAIIEALKGMKTQGFEDYDPNDFIEQKHPIYPLHWDILQKAKDLTEGVEVDLNKPLDEQCDEEWKCPCNVCQKNRLDFHKEYDNL